ncbi:hypothetical protein ACHLDZ_004080 [Escherichia coli]|nr:hypothetical protein [Escherichia coli]
MSNIAPQDLINALTPFWQLPPQTCFDLNTVKTEKVFCDLKAYCTANYETMDAGIFADIPLARALCLVGVPCIGQSHHHASTVTSVATKVHEALTRTTTTKIYLCPLDCADHIEQISFGNAEIREFSASELEELLGYQQFKRLSYYKKCDLNALSEFKWLVVREEVDLHPKISHRAYGFLATGLQRDYGAIKPYYQRYPDAFNLSLFGLLLAPWEEWVTHIEIEWKAFHIKWVHTVENDLFSDQKNIPDADTLTWDYSYYNDENGNEHEMYHPFTLSSFCPQDALALIVNNQLMVDIDTAINNGLINEAARHHFIKAFLSDGIDEFLAHIVVIDACLGEPRELERKLNLTKYEKNLKSTGRLKYRLVGLLEDSSVKASIDTLYRIRSEYVHGRDMADISGADKNLARALARKTLLGIIKMIQHTPKMNKLELLTLLLRKGMNNLTDNT